VRPALIFDLTDQLTLWLGYAAIGNFGDQFELEHRIWQQLQHRAELEGIILVNRTRLEQRFFEGAPGEVGLRLRHLVRAMLPVGTVKPGEEHRWAVVISNEVFFNLNAVSGEMTPGFDQNRAFLGVNVKVRKNLTLDLGYMNVFQRERERLFEMGHVLFISLTYEF